LPLPSQAKEQRMAIDALHADMIHFQEEKNVIALQVTFTDYVSCKFTPAPVDIPDKNSFKR
jgi:hypothetical protein